MHKSDIRKGVNGKGQRLFVVRKKKEKTKEEEEEVVHGRERKKGAGQLGSEQSQFLIGKPIN